ncbi:MAG: hypothetical protein JNM82_01325 [Rhodocyclaceae bacterium]|nr:hypothetical protein [Rhodocyclaceae bacterium]
MAADEKRRLAGILGRRFFLRFHISLILAFAFATGLLATRGFLALGLDTLHWRWPLALLLAYGAFLLGLRLWLAYVGLGRYVDDEPDVDLPDLGFSGGDGSGGGLSLGDGSLAADLPDGGLSPGSGGFGGGGASGDFATPVAEADSGGGLLSSVKLPDADLGGADDGCLYLLVLAAILALLAAVLGVGIFVIWNAPSILAEAAFEAALAAGLVRPTRRIDHPGWVGGALRGTWKPFALVFAAAMAVAWLAETFAPEARTLPEAIRYILDMI